MFKSGAVLALAVLLVCAFFSALARGVLDSYAVFILPLAEAFAWGRTETSAGYSIAFLAFGFSGPVVGWFFDRFGPVFNYAVGIVVTGIGAYLCSRLTGLWQLYVYFGLVVGFGTAFFGNVTFAGLLRRWFTSRLNTAMALVYAGGTLGILIVAPAAQYVIVQAGWRTAFQALAVVVLFGLPPLLLLLLINRAGRGDPTAGPDSGGERSETTENPEVHVSAPMTLAKALRDPAFWGLGITFICTGIGMFSVLLQIPSFLIEKGYEPQFAANAFGLIGLLAPMGMIGFGLLGDIFRRRTMVLISYLMTASGVACFLIMNWQPSLLWLALSIFLFGGSFGVRGPSISAISAALFAGPNFARIYGSITIFMGLGAATGTWFGGFWRDLTGAYTFGFGFSLVMVCLGALPFLLVRRMASAR